MYLVLDNPIVVVVLFGWMTVSQSMLSLGTQARKEVEDALGLEDRSGRFKGNKFSVVPRGSPSVCLHLTRKKSICGSARARENDLGEEHPDALLSSGLHMTVQYGII